MDKMIMAIISRNEAELVLDALISNGFTATFAETRGGMLRQSQYSLFIAAKSTDVEEVCRIIQKNCTVEVALEDTTQAKEGETKESAIARVGGAIVFTWDIISTKIY